MRGGMNPEGSKIRAVETEPGEGDTPGIMCSKRSTPKGCQSRATSSRLIPSLASLRDAPPNGGYRGSSQLTLWPDPRLRICDPFGVKTPHVKVFRKFQQVAGWEWLSPRKTIISDFRVRVRSFSAMDCVASLCVVAPLRDHNLLWESMSRKAAKALSSPEGPKTTEPAFTSRNRFFLTLYSGVRKPFRNTLH
jgi:hypothetical protein